MEAPGLSRNVLIVLSQLVPFAVRVDAIRETGLPGGFAEDYPQGKPFARLGEVTVAPHAGAWIETLSARTVRL